MTNDKGKPLPAILAAVVFLWPGGLGGQEKKPAAEPPPIKALLITGGASHDYTTRKEILVEGIRERVKRRIEWVVRHEGEGESDVPIPVFEGSGWADGYDIVVHDYCFPRVTDRTYVDRILAPHRAGLAAVLLHGTMHSFRTGDDAWFEFCGATSRRHGRPQDFSVEAAPGENAIVAGMAPWTVPRGELYLIEQLHPGSTPLTFSRFTDGEGEDQATTWSHFYGPAQARVFASTLGNETPTLLTPAFLDLIAKGFLWALDDLKEESVTVIPPGESLASLKLETPAVPLPRPGPSLVTRGRASALSVAPSPLLGAEMAIDGDPMTYWEADSPGPSSWQVDMRREQQVGAVMITWKGEAPRHYEVEGSRDGLSWRALLETTGQGMMPVSTGFDPRPMRFLRVSLSATEPGFVPGIREVAAYGHMDDLPAAFPDFVSINGAPRVALHTAGTDESESSVRLAPGWSVGGRGHLPGGEKIVQIIPTASGEVFVLGQGATDGQRKVYLGTPGGDGGIAFREYLGSLTGSALIAYDGEWIYTLDGADLKAYRDSNGDGIADDRMRTREMFSTGEGTVPPVVRYNRFRAGPDGWLYAVAETSGDLAGFNSRHELVRFPGHGLIRFRTTGHDLGVHASSDAALEDFHFGAAGQILVETTKAENEDGPEIRLLPPLPGHAWQGLPVLAWPPAIAEDPRWENLDAIKDRDRLFIRQEDGLFPQIGEISGLDEIVADGGRIWFTREGKNGVSLGVLTRTGEDPVVPVKWDTTPTKALFTHLSSRSRAARTEAVFEILRRKHNPLRDLERVLGSDGANESHATALSALSAMGGDKAGRALVAAARSDVPMRQALAFQHLGDHRDLKNHPVFSEISRTTVPAVTAAILGAMARTGTTIDGLDALVLSFASHPDVTLAASARAFLQERGAVAVSFDVLDDEAAGTAWPAAFEVLSGIRRVTVVEGIVLRLKQTRSSRFRALGIEALLHLYHDDRVHRREWEGTPLVDLFLSASLHDHRVDRAALLRGMTAVGVPAPSPAVLVELGSGEIPLEAFAVNALSANFAFDEIDFPVAAKPWLETLVKSPERDRDLRTRALGLLAANGEEAGYRRLFGEVANFAGDAASGDASADLIRRWLSRKDHLLQIAWLMEESVNGEGNRATLASSTILSLMGNDGTPPADRETLRSHLEDIIKAGIAGSGLGPLVAALPQAAEKEAALIMTVVDRQAGEPLRAIARERLLDRSIQSSKDPAGASVGGIDTETLAGSLSSVDGEAALGRHLFRQLACDACHNIHGEGPAIGPDLATSPRLGSLNGLIDSILVRGGGFASRENAAVYELTTGRRLAGFEAIERAGEVDLRDRVGNVFSLDSGDLRAKLPLTSPGMICDTAASLTLAEFASLVQYLKSLGD